MQAPRPPISAPPPLAPSPPPAPAHLERLPALWVGASRHRVQHGVQRHALNVRPRQRLLAARQRRQEWQQATSPHCRGGVAGGPAADRASCTAPPSSAYSGLLLLLACREHRQRCSLPPSQACLSSSRPPCLPGPAQPAPARMRPSPAQPSPGCWPHQQVQQALVPGPELAQPPRVLAQPRRHGVQQPRGPVAQRAAQEAGVAQVRAVCGGGGGMGFKGSMPFCVGVQSCRTRGAGVSMRASLLVGRGRWSGVGD